MTTQYKVLFEDEDGRRFSVYVTLPGENHRMDQITPPARNRAREKGSDPAYVLKVRGGFFGNIED